MLVHAFESLGKFYMFDANTNTILPLNGVEQYKLAKNIENQNITEKEIQFIEKFNKFGFLEDEDIKEIEHPESEFLQYHLERKLKKLTLQVTQSCNLRCEYCVYSGWYETREHNHKTMDFDVAKKAIDYVLDRCADENDINFGFYGGEPLLAINLIRQCVDYINNHKGNKEITFTITTNGTLLTPEIYKELIDNDFLINVSLDGPKEVHDTSRVYANGKGSFDDIMKNIADICAQYPDAQEKISFLSVASPNMPDSCVDKFYKVSDVMSNQKVSMFLLSDLYTEKSIEYSETFFSLLNQERAKLFLYMLGKLSLENVSPLVTNEISDINRRYNLLERIDSLPISYHPGGPCLPGPQRLFATVDGEFFPCERVSEESNVMNIGNIYDGIDLNKSKIILNVGKTTAEECKKCWAIMHCSLCAAHSDNLTNLSKEIRLNKCSNSKILTEESFKDVCFLKSYDYKFAQNA